MEGLFSENGPFILNNDGSNVTKNDYSWNKNANMLYFESPAGVGFSQNLDENYPYNDTTTASDNYKALKIFFEIFDDLKNRNFFITGESYGGSYIPHLA